jgi:TolB-like protein/Flp pilus assembly protein TadD
MKAMALEADGPSTRDRIPDSVPSLAVLYFHNLAQDPDSEYFCSGITEDILTDLSKIAGLRVASRNAVTRYRGEEVDIAKVGSELGVQAILEGSVRRSGDRIRITTQLISASDGFQLWAERYDRTLDDVFAVQDEIATAIVEALRVAMTPSDVQRIAKDRPKDARAYDLYLKGREEYGRYSRESMQKALDLFHEAIAIDPGYALAWAGIADCHAQFVQQGWSPDSDEALRLGMDAAKQAVSIDPRLPEGHKAEGLVRHVNGDREGSRLALARAIQADPTYTPALINLSVNCFVTADIAGAERLLRRVLEIDPQDVFALLWLGMLLCWTDRPEEAWRAAERIRELSEEPVYVTASYAIRILVSAHRNDAAEAERLLEAAAGDRPDPDVLEPHRAYFAIEAGRMEEAREILEKTEFVINPTAVAFLAGAACRLGMPELAEKVVQRRSGGRSNGITARLEPMMHPLLDRKLFGRRRSDLTLVWPLQAPMIDETRHRLFKRVMIETGKPEGSDVLQLRSGID